MGDRPDILTWLWSEPGKAALAGALGGIVRWVTLREHWRDGILSLLVGAICAVYLGPLVAPILEPVIGRLAPGGDTAGFSAFIVGIGGMSISGMLIDIFRARRAEVGERTSDKGEDDAQP
jgi:hypothetical protein